MKTIIALMALIASLSAVAGPEDHIQNQTCYNLNSIDTLNAPKIVPREICLETLSIDTDDESIDVYSYFYPQFFKSMKVVKFAQRNEDFFVFKAANALAQKVTLELEGQVDMLGEGNPALLNVSVTVENSLNSKTIYYYDLQ